MAVKAYFGRGGLEKQRGGPRRSSCSRGNTGLYEAVRLRCWAG